MNNEQKCSPTFKRTRFEDISESDQNRFKIANEMVQYANK